MKFILECDGNSGLVLMDQRYQGEMDSDILYSMDILLDYEGETELFKNVRAFEKILTE
ncbi:MAG: hypothetical protein Q8942_12870 [Bacillota bacterium]|nr:hypothetical protein [Bacillota bacterium]